MGADTLHIFSSEDEVDKSLDETVSVKELLSAGNRTAYQELWGTFTRIGNSQTGSPALLCCLWPHVVLPGRNGKGSLLTAVLFARRLKTMIEDTDYETVVSHGLEDPYRVALTDLGATFGLSVQDASTGEGTSSQPLFTLGIITFLFDQIFSILLRPFFARRGSIETLVFPFPDRYKSLKPVVEALDSDTLVVPSPLTLSWLVRHTDPFDSLDARPIDTYSSLQTLYDQMSTLLSLYRQLSDGEFNFEADLRSELQREVDISLPRTVHHASSVAVQNNTRQILTYYLYCRAVRQESPQDVVVGGMSPQDRLALSAGADTGSDLSYVPHSILSGYEVMPANDSTNYFIEGSYAETYLEASPMADAVPTVRPTGRPYLEQLNAEPRRAMENDSSELQVTIATQPYEDSVRREYVRTLLDALNALPLDHGVVLKIHPSESPSFYSDLLAEYPAIEMETGAIRPVLDESDLLVTINSNVGIEAMIRDGCCLSFNMWEPVTPVSPYVELGPVPLSTTRAELTEFLSSLDETTYDRLRERQASFVADGVELDDCTTQIAAQIQGAD